MIENQARAYGRDAHTVHPQKTKKKKSVETKATDSNAVTSGQTTSSTIDRLSSGHHLSSLRGAHPIGDLNADADRHQDILSCSLDCSLHLSHPALAFSLVSTGVKGVPLAYMERSTGQLVGDILGRFIETDSGRGGTCMGSFLIIKVVIDVTQPLKRCLHFTFPKVGSRLLLIKYEKLPNYCYLCALHDHVLNQCSLRDSVFNHGDFKPFGSWLRAEVKEWLNEHEMEPPRSLRSRWVMKAPSSDE
ncbi:hypothetical protein ACE6H2_022086 [Prunus campanulata]